MQQGFGEWRPAARLTFHQQPANFLATGRSTWFAGADDHEAAFLKKGDQALDLRGFAGPLAPLKGNELAALSFCHPFNIQLLESSPYEIAQAGREPSEQTESLHCFSGLEIELE